MTGSAGAATVRAAGATWAEQLATTGVDTLDATERRALTDLVVDALAIASAGSEADGVREALRAAEALGAGPVAVPWTDLSLPAPQAGLALSALIHAWDFDDTHDTAVVHTTAVALPAALATGLAAGKDGAAVLDGVVVGIQVLSRLGSLVGPQHGIIRTAGLGAVAAAAASARTLGLDAEGIDRAMALALPATGSRFSRQVVADSAPNKRLQPGLAVQTGITAAHLAQAGLTGPAHWLEGDYGLASISPEGADLAQLWAPGWEGARISLKPYPACRFTHSAVTATTRALAALPAGATVGSAVVHVPAGSAYALVSRPFARRGTPVVDAQFSIPWLVGAHLHTGRMDLRTIAGPDLLDPAVESAAAAVTVLQDAPETAEMVEATVDLVTTDGQEVSATAPMIGSPEEPMGDVDRDAKMLGCLAVGGHDDAVLGTLLDVVERLGSLTADELPTALAALRPAPEPLSDNTINATDRETTTTEEHAWTSA